MNFILDSQEINSNSPYAIRDFSNIILKYLSEEYSHNYKELLFVCIGTDRATGDSLGPLVGHKLTPILSKYKNIHILGTLNEPIHAKNLESKIEFIKNNFENPFLIAIDASLGRFDKIGMINIKKGSLKPGLGVNKKLPNIGDISITGVVNIGGIMEYVVLQNTRLSLVMTMADIITRSIHLAVYKHFIEDNSVNRAIQIKQNDQFLKN
ncbi:MAG: spore protease YyaC [Tissierellaceae bacterium]|jgi:putative sporulation protein YyaC|nr:spore protease YyaC [Tissierellaceae bacterium]